MDKIAGKRIGIIGGSGLYEIEGLKSKDRIEIYTPFGKPSDKLNVGILEGREVVFLPRHGRGHRLLPSEINYRANIWAMKKLGVEQIISVSAVGSFKKEVKPGDIVIVDQFFDRTNQTRKSTFFGDGIVAHVSFAHPICPVLSKLLYEVGQKECGETEIHPSGTYLNMEGPAFSTKAESLIYKSWGVDVIGMTNLSEAKLSREAEICYATIAIVTDYDCWREDEPDSAVNLSMVVKNLNKGLKRAREIVKKVIPKLPEKRNCECASALKNAILTQYDMIPPATLERLELIVGKYVGIERKKQ